MCEEFDSGQKSVSIETVAPLQNSAPTKRARSTVELLRRETLCHWNFDRLTVRTLTSDVNKDLTFKAKDKDKDQTLKAKDQDKDQTYKDKEQDKDQTPKDKDKDKDQTFKAKDQDKD